VGEGSRRFCGCRNRTRCWSPVRFSAVAGRQESTKIRGGLQHKIFRINGDFRSPEESSRENANVFEVVKTGSAQLGPRTISKLSAHPPDFSGLDGKHWSVIADRRHGPWRGMKTAISSPVEVKYVRFAGTFSNREPFRVQRVQAFPAP